MMLPGAIARLAIAVTVTVLTWAAGAGADVYKYVDPEGRVYLTDRPPHDGYRRIVKTRKGWRESRVNFRDMEKNRKRFAPVIARIARREQLPEALIHAVIVAESAYDPEAVSHAGAVGLMQLMPDTARRYGVRDRRNPLENVDAGTRYLKDLLEMFDNNLPLALAGYNAGEHAVEQHGRRIPPYRETRAYVRKVLGLYDDLRRNYNDKAPPEVAAAAADTG